MASDEYLSSYHFLSLFVFSLPFLLMGAEANQPLSGRFHLTSAPLTSKTTYLFSSLAASPPRPSLANDSVSPPFNYSSKVPFKYSMALVVSISIGTPPQPQRMVIDTGSQLSWIPCSPEVPRTTRKMTPAPPSTSSSSSFSPSNSTSFSPLSCNSSLCKPPIPDFTFPTDCDEKGLCSYSCNYADGTFAKGNLVQERLSFSGEAQTPSLVLGCTVNANETAGILGMNLGRLSFSRQANISKFSYCVPLRRDPNLNSTGAFYFGENPNSHSFNYVNLLTFSLDQQMPNLDPFAYTVPLSGIKIGGNNLSIPSTVFRADAGGSGQTMIDSGSQYTFLVQTAYSILREEVKRRAGSAMKTDFVYESTFDMCFDRPNVALAKKLIGDVAFVFENGVEITVGKERIMDDVGGDVHCMAVGQSDLLGMASNIIGNFYQQNLWVEFDLIKKRMGFGVANCSRSI